ncbi:hypothetical protein EXM63_08360 [Clostridium botulinum]|uniref:Uncharacterized protein n=1 Tax=Clostridium botulinum TaxID=1491 RepID=A0A6M0SZ17_CLOBO|nr:hypothetical protein [Clostridium sporogenes]NFA59171.1 hypothetical protein [Clostridium botulinum]NFI74778.1 hypothetical protein [Clostridium sporogenes]NFL71089.1 hypothetical protein [Clostridium sporogenes]NFM24905.1 hypothetical protein [Clostridium sporogenes]NFP62925.1 hypothetical protein [Clostridium sporogenes]
MKYYLQDILYVFRLSFYLFFISFVIGCLIGAVLPSRSFYVIFLWGCRMSQYIAVFGMAVAGISFTKEELLRPLNREKQWKNYFKKLNLSFVILFMSILSLMISYTIQSLFFRIIIK